MVIIVVRRRRTHPGIDEGDAVGVPGERAHGFGHGLVQRPSIPDFDESVVAAAKQDLRSRVGERHSVHVVIVRLKWRS